MMRMGAGGFGGGAGAGIWDDGAAGGVSNNQNTSPLVSAAAPVRPPRRLSCGTVLACCFRTSNRGVDKVKGRPGFEPRSYH